MLYVRPLQRSHENPTQYVMHQINHHGSRARDSQHDDWPHPLCAIPRWQGKAYILRIIPVHDDLAFFALRQTECSLVIQFKAFPSYCNCSVAVYPPNSSRYMVRGTLPVPREQPCDEGCSTCVIGFCSIAHEFWQSHSHASAEPLPIGLQHLRRP
jgi:hypothetical protein